MRFALCLMLLLLSRPAAAAHRLGFSLAPTFYQVRDDLLEPVRMLGPGGQASLEYRHETDAGFEQVLLRGGSSALTDRFTASGPGFGQAVQFEVDVQFQRVLWRNDAFIVQFGAALRAAEFIHWLPNWDDAHAYWLTDYDIGPVFQATWLLHSETSLVANVLLPLVDLVARPASDRTYLADPSNLSAFYGQTLTDRAILQTLDTLFAITADVAWRQKLDDSWDLQLGYRLDYRSDLLPQWTQVLTQSLYVQVLYAL